MGPGRRPVPEEPLRLLASLAVGADGILSGHGSVVDDLHVELFGAVQRSDLRAARRVWDRLQPFAEVCYAEPFLDGHNRMKEALALHGRVDGAHVRPPLVALPATEVERVQAAVLDARLPVDSIIRS